jgi:hypothetical protein
VKYLLFLLLAGCSGTLTETRSVCLGLCVETTLETKAVSKEVHSERRRT